MAERIMREEIPVYSEKYGIHGVIKDCERKALKRCLGNEAVYEELMKKYDANFMFGEV
ncbi:hypothetical protein [Butyrivibrio sp.]|uniref:hypothetical protein n=1 Tax=Butyrivibrio sp. TaxID=28121 RepID=UPI0025BA443F|nr:hypothetical protein [Butyrivibrio sp.]